MLIVLQVFLSVNVLFCVEIPFVAAQDTCYSNRGCSSDKVCCKNLSFSVFQCRDTKRFDIASKHRSETSCLPCCDRSWSWIESRAWYESRQYGKCSKSCIGMRCRARIHSDCGVGECCRSLRCVNCSDPGCRDHSDCPNNQYCCKEWINGTRRCIRNCIRKKCSSDEECGLSEHCHMRRYCQRGRSCRVEGNDSCDDGLFCCKDNFPIWYKRVTGVCRKSCNWYPCADDSDRGPPDECCLGERCEIFMRANMQFQFGLS